jgi:uncharacterized protein (DUF952 family)
VSRTTLHLVSEARWDARDPDAPYTPEAYEREGFIHCTDGDAEMVKTANRFYRDDPQPFLALTVDLDETGSPWRVDDPGTPYPHVYGPIDPRAVLSVRRFTRDADGTFTGIADR